MVGVVATVYALGVVVAVVPELLHEDEAERALLLSCYTQACCNSYVYILNDILEYDTYDHNNYSCHSSIHDARAYDDA
jgi:hypothetical protein